MKLFNITFLGLGFNAQTLLKLIDFSFMPEASLNYGSTQDSLFYPRKRAILSILRPQVDVISSCGDKFEKKVSFEDMVHFIDENVMTYVVFHRGIFSTQRLPQKLMVSTGNGKLFPDPAKTANASQVTSKITVLFKKSIALASF